MPLRKSQHSKIYLCPPPTAPLVDSLMFMGKILHRGQICSTASPHALLIRASPSTRGLLLLYKWLPRPQPTSAAHSRERSLCVLRRHVPHKSLPQPSRQRLTTPTSPTNLVKLGISLAAIGAVTYLPCSFLWMTAWLASHRSRENAKN